MPFGGFVQNAYNSIMEQGVYEELEWVCHMICEDCCDSICYTTRGHSQASELATESQRSLVKASLHMFVPKRHKEYIFFAAKKRFVEREYKSWRGVHT